MTPGNERIHLLVSIANILISTIALVTTLLLLAGYSFRIGYLGAFGLGIGSIPIDFSNSVGEAYYMGLLLIVEIYDKIWWPIAWIFLVAIVLTLLVMILNSKSRLGATVKQWLLFPQAESPKSLSWRSATTMFFSEIFPKFFNIFLLSIIAFSALVMVMVFPHQEGRAEGNRQIQSFAEVDYSCAHLPTTGLSCVKVIVHESQRILTEGLSVSGGSESHLAVFDGQSVQILERDSSYIVSVYSKATQRNQD